MSEKEAAADLLHQKPVTIHRGITILSVILISAGIAGFLLGLGVSEDYRLRAWGVFLVNFLFWSGLAQMGIVFAAILQITNGAWGRPVKRIAEGMASFLPVSLVLFLAMIWGRNTLYVWIGEPIPEKAFWLNAPSLFARDLILLLALYGLSMVFLYYSLRPDVGARGQGAESDICKLVSKLKSNWQGLEAEKARRQRVLAKISPLIILLYAAVFSVIAVDLVMSLAPHWYSVLFGAYFFIGNFYLGLAGIIILSIILRRYLKLEGYITSSQFHDLGKLMLGFCLLWVYFFWSQYLVIWYGNLPEEIGFVMTRTKEAPWNSISKTLFVTNFAFPFLYLLSRRIKENPKTLFVAAASVAVGMWLERFQLVVPSLWHGKGLPLGWVEVMITAGFFGGFLSTYTFFMKRFPMLPITDPLLGRSHGEH